MDAKANIIDLKFCDFPGLWQHFSISSSSFSEDIFEEGVGYDGSNIRGFQKFQESDMLLIPDAKSAIENPFTEIPALSMICNIRDPVTLQPYVAVSSEAAQTEFPVPRYQ